MRRVGAESLSADRAGANQLAFSFQRGDAEPDRARRDLGDVIGLLVRRAEVEEALAAIASRFNDESDVAAWDDQRHLIDERRETDRRLSELMQITDDAA